MELTAAVNDILRDDITKIGYTLLPPDFQGDIHTSRRVQEDISKIVDIMGEQSTAVQGLSRVITSAAKLRTALDHTLYIMKDAEANGGKGEVIGILKVARKHLYLFDECTSVLQVEPLCVLDFFVLSERQRRGHGRKLFDYMLQDMGVTAHAMAIDGPSPKLEHFLRKNYGIERLIKQSNNFAVSSQFFTMHADSCIPGRNMPIISRTPTVGRFAAHQPRSDIASVIHGGGGRSGSRVTQRPPSPRPLSPRRTSPERPSTLPLETPSAAPPAAPARGTVNPCRRDPQVTDKGFFDVKFFHNKLW